MLGHIAELEEPKVGGPLGISKTFVESDRCFGGTHGTPNFWVLSFISYFFPKSFFTTKT